MKRVFIIHGWDGNPNQHWLPWLKKELEKKGFQVQVPEMPNAGEPEINAWVNKLKQIVKNPDKDTYFVGHSIGCQTIMRYLESLPENAKVGDVVFVAGWFKLDNLESEEEEEIATPWIENPINYQKIKKMMSNLTVMLSDNEPYGCVGENAKMFKEKLGAKVIIQSNKGHFTADDGVTEIPEILKLL